MQNLLRAAAAVFAAALIAAAPAAADVFTVRGVEVDETAETAAQSRVRAIAVGQRDAARRLIERLTLPEDRAAAPPLDEASAARLVSGFQVEEEALAGARYIGRLTVQFDPESVRDLLESYGMPYVLSTARPALVVPLWRENEQTVLWEPTPWSQAWLVAGTADELVPVLSPSGDLRDISALGVEDALALEPNALQRLAANYGAGRVLVALAAPAGEPGQITARMVGVDLAGGGERTDYGTLPVAEPVELARMAAGLLQDDWKRRIVVRQPSVTTIAASVLYDTTAGWMELQRTIGGEPLVQSARLEALTNDGAYMTIEHRGTAEQLALALQQNGAFIDQSPRGWVISRGFGRGGPQGQAAPAMPGTASPGGEAAGETTTAPGGDGQELEPVAPIQPGSLGSTPTP